MEKNIYTEPLPPGKAAWSVCQQLRGAAHSGQGHLRAAYLTLIVVNHPLIILSRCLQLLDLEVRLVEFVLHWSEASLEE